MVTSGYCPNGMRITDPTECQAAGTALSMAWGTAGTWAGVPYGCLQYTNSQVYFQSRSEETAQCSTTYYCICRATPPPPPPPPTSPGPPPSAPALLTYTLDADGCTWDICGDIGNDCCASSTWGEAQVCRVAGFSPVSSPTVNLRNPGCTGYQAGIGNYKCCRPWVNPLPTEATTGLVIAAATTVFGVAQYLLQSD